MVYIRDLSRFSSIRENSGFFGATAIQNISFVCIDDAYLLFRKCCRNHVLLDGIGMDVVVDF